MRVYVYTGKPSLLPAAQLAEPIGDMLLKCHRPWLCGQGESEGVHEVGSVGLRRSVSCHRGRGDGSLRASSALAVLSPRFDVIWLLRLTVPPWCSAWRKPPCAFRVCHIT